VWQCKKCGVALHLEEYFEVYHTQQSYKGSNTGEFIHSILCMQVFREKIYWLILYDFFMCFYPHGHIITGFKSE
jgi:hypothetical protein